MSFSIELPQTYTFSLCIDRGGHTIVDTTVEVPDTREGITRAKRTIQRLMNEYAPVPKAPVPTPELATENQAPIDSTGTRARTSPGEKTGWCQGAAPAPLQGVRAYLRHFPAGTSNRGGLQMRASNRPHHPAGPIPLHLPLLREGKLGPDKSGGPGDHGSVQMWRGCQSALGTQIERVPELKEKPTMAW